MTTPKSKLGVGKFALIGLASVVGVVATSPMRVKIRIQRVHEPLLPTHTTAKDRRTMGALQKVTVYILGQVSDHVKTN